MRKVIHLLPYDGVGGAEAAARSMAEAPPDDFEFELQFVFPGVRSQAQRRATFNPLAFLRATRRVLRERPDVLACSLWRACIVGVIVKLLRPRTRLVVFIHNSVDAHAADFLATRIAVAVADGVWADSQASLRLRFRSGPRAPITVIPFLCRHLPPALAAEHAVTPYPGFVFWGRLAPQKNLWRALKVFAEVHREVPNARFTIIGPDSGELSGLRAWSKRAGLERAVEFSGPLDFDAIREIAARNSFYLQASDYEGMAMAVVEAMQLGLVPVVTPVGEIGRYCRHGVNAIIIEDDGQAAADVLELLRSPLRWSEMRGRAMATWHDSPLYRDAVAAACRNLLASKES